MTSLITNSSAMNALTALRGVNKDLATTQDRISTGKQVQSAKDNSAYFQISETMKGDRAAYDSINSGLTLTKMKFLHPFRVRQFMPLNILVTFVWMLSSALLILQYPANHFWLLALWWLASAYFVGMCLWRSAREWFPARG